MREAVVTLLFLAAACPAWAECPVPEGDVVLSRPSAGSVVREFGNTYDELAKAKTDHNGVDLEAASGDAVYAARAGTVTDVGSAEVIGTFIRVDHGGGLVTGYGHLGQSTVKAGDCVNGGQELGKAGATGVTPGPQLHFEVTRDGAYIDPMPLLQ